MLRVLQDTNSRLSSEFRPEEVKIWMKNHRQYEKLPKIKSPTQFAVTWKKWWASLQPSVRTADGAWPLPRVEPVDPTDWNVVAKGGGNGFFLVVLTLAWWLWAVMHENMSMIDVLEAVEDVSWVLNMVTAYVKTRVDAEDEEDEGRPSKRQRLD